MIRFYRADGITPLDGYAWPTNPEAGQQSATVDFVARNEGETEYLNPLLVIRTRSLTESGKWLASGVAPQDEYWVKARFTGFDRGDDPDPTWSVDNTGWQHLGASTGLRVSAGRWPAGAEIHGQYSVHAAGDATPDQPWDVMPAFLVDEHSIAVPPALTRADRGVLHGIGDPTRSAIVWKEGDVFLPTVDGSDELYVGAGMLLHQGTLHGFIGETVAFNQNDSAAAALADGEKYLVTVSVGPSGRTYTKGLKGTAPEKPAAPAGEPVLGWVTIEYGAGGTVIGAEDLEWRYVYDRYHPASGGGLLLRLHPGEALAGGTWRFASEVQPLLLDAFDDSTCYVWQLRSGLFTATATDERPDDGAELWCEVTCAAGAITAIVDRRRYAGETVEIRLSGQTPGSPGEIVDAVVGHEHLVIDEVLFRLKAHGGGSAGQWQLDAKINGATLYTDFATEDWRPTWTHNAAADELLVGWTIWRKTILRRGDVVSLHTLEHPTGAAAVRAELVLVCRKP